MMKKCLLLLVLLVSLSFAAADWIPFSFLAAFIALTVLILLYMLSYLVSSSEMRMLAKSEMYQVVVTVFLIILFVILDSYSSQLFSTILTDLFGSSSSGLNHVDYALKIASDTSDYEWELLAKVTEKLGLPFGSMASSSATCSILGSSFTYPGCIGVQVASSSVTFATNLMVSALLANNSQIFLLKLASSFFFPVLLPIGLFLRCFQFTRGAGGLLISIAVAFYFALPGAIMLTKGISEKAVADAGIPNPDFPDIDYLDESFGDELLSFEVNADCNPLDMDPKAGRAQAKRLIGDNGEDLVEPLLYYFFVDGVMTTVLNILITLSVARGLSGVFGSEVDISALARIS